MEILNAIKLEVVAYQPFLVCVGLLFFVRCVVKYLLIPYLSIGEGMDKSVRRVTIPENSFCLLCSILVVVAVFVYSRSDMFRSFGLTGCLVILFWFFVVYIVVRCVLGILSCFIAFVKNRNYHSENFGVITRIDYYHRASRNYRRYLRYLAESNMANSERYGRRVFYAGITKEEIRRQKRYANWYDGRIERKLEKQKTE